MTKSDLKQYEGMYYIGDIVDMDGDGWVDEETAELILLEHNGGTSVSYTHLTLPTTSSV